MAKTNLTPDEMELELGQQVKRLRLFRDIKQTKLAEMTGVSVKTLRNLESGSGSSIKTLVCVARALGREDWLQGLAAVGTTGSLTPTGAAQRRQGASHSRQGRST